MWSSDLTRRGFLVAGLAALAACQFRPALGPNSGAKGLIGKVGFQGANSTASFELVGQLQRRLGMSSDPEWRVTYKITKGSQTFSAADAKRIQLSGDVSFELVPLAGQRRKITDKVSGFVTYSEARTTTTQTGLVLSNRAAKEDAERRLMVLLADRMVDRMIVELARAHR